MDIIIKSFQTYYKLPELLSTECDWIQWTNNIESKSYENIMCPKSKLEENARIILLESNKSFENLLITLLKYHFEKNTIKNFNDTVEYEDAYQIINDVAKDKKLQSIFDFSIYNHWSTDSIYPEVIYIAQFFDHIFKTLHFIFKALNKASIKSYNILEKRKPIKLINEKKQLENKYTLLSTNISNAIKNNYNNEYINKLITEQNILQNTIQELDRKIIDKKLEEITNRIDKNLVLGEKFINGFVYNTDIILYLIFLNTTTIPIELINTLNTQLKISNPNFITFLIKKFNNIIKGTKICYLTKSDMEEFEKLPITSKTEEIKILLASKTIPPSHKLKILLTKFIPLSDPLGESILYSIIQKLGFGSRMTF